MDINAEEICIVRVDFVNRLESEGSKVALIALLDD